MKNIQNLYMAIKKLKECMKQPYETLPLQRKAQQHEQQLYLDALKKGSDAEQRKNLYRQHVEHNCRKLQAVVDQQRKKQRVSQEPREGQAP
eukprot:SAG11_NODE_16494_length_546_cov_0.648770_1_plen_90_part_10